VLAEPIDPAPADPRATRALAAWYATGVGAIALVPWIGPLLAERGWSDPAVALWLAAIPAGRLMVVPAWAALADRLGPSRVLGAALALSVVFTALLMVPGASAAPYIVAGAALGWAWSRAPAGPIVDATAVHRLGAGYGRIRAVGSVSFLAAAAASGVLRDLWAPGPIALSGALSLATLVLTVPLSRSLPPRAPIPPSRAAWFGLWRHPVLAPLAAVSVLHGASISMYDNLFALHVERLTLPSRVTGSGLALGVAVEVAVLFFGGSLLGRLGAHRLLMIAVASSIPRFALTAASTHPAVLIGAQSLHGLGFGAYWLAGTALFSAHSPASLRNSGQALLVTAMFGAGPVLGLTLATAALQRSDTAGPFALAAGLSTLALTLLLLAGRRIR
jgi:MFS transporter, PPP family, 3-phenylpropionic acid transporter